MWSARAIFLAGFISLVLISEATATTKFADGPCSSEAYTLCRLSSGKELPTIRVVAEPIAVAKPRSTAKPSIIHTVPTHWPSEVRAPKTHQLVTKTTGKASPIEGINLNPFKSRKGEHPSVAKMENIIWRHFVSIIYDERPKVPKGFHCIPPKRAKLANQWGRTLAKRLPPQIQRVRHAESSDRQYDEETGCVLQGKENPLDRGGTQINLKFNGRILAAIGVDPHELRGNMLAAIFLAIPQGLEPWSSSEDKWGPEVPEEQRRPLWKQPLDSLGM